jgi:hypothetical protein
MSVDVISVTIWNILLSPFKSKMVDDMAGHFEKAWRTRKYKARIHGVYNRITLLQLEEVEEANREMISGTFLTLVSQIMNLQRPMALD